MNKRLLNNLFEAWISTYHPWFGIVFGIGTILFLLGIIVSLILIFFVAWWWKVFVFSLGSMIILKMCQKVVTQILLDEFTKN